MGHSVVAARNISCPSQGMTSAACNALPQIQSQRMPGPSFSGVKLSMRLQSETQPPGSLRCCAPDCASARR